MDVRPGYKKTEVGVIPEDWETSAAAAVCAMVVDCKNRTPPVVSDEVYAVVRTPNVRNGKFVQDGLRYTDAASFREWTARAVPQLGDVLITREAPLGEVCLVPEGKQVCLGQRMMLYRPDPAKIESVFLLYALSSTPVRKRLLEKVGGSTVGHAKVDDIRNLIVPMPPQSERRAIAEALSDTDAFIESLGQLLAKKRHLKQGAMQELLTGKKRLPGFSGELKVKRLDAIAQIRSGGTPSTNQPDFWDGEVQWCTPTDITALNGFKYLTQTARTITAEGLKSSSAELIPAHSVVMTSRATIGVCAINVFPVATNQGFKNFVPFEDTDGEFLYYLLQTKKQDFISLCGGSTFLEVGRTQLAGFEIALPCEKTEQTAISTTLSDMDAEITTLEAKLAKTRQLKQGMMHNLLTGKIRLL